MSKLFHNMLVGLDEDLDEKVSYLVPDYSEYRILKKSVDARRRHDVHFVYTVEVAEKNEKLKREEFNLDKISFNQSQQEKPIIVGTGPAGLFAAIRLLERGIPCKIFERGSQSTERIKGINQFWRYGKLDTRNNVCFGEGGAGLYSDGKLITRIKSPHIPYVLRKLVEFGAPEEIEYYANPHVGSDKIRRIIPKIREYLISNACEIFYDTQVTEILFEANQTVGIKTEHGATHMSPFVVLATGHSATDMLEHLRDKGVFLEGKSFALGLRVEHPQKIINQIQYRTHADNPKLGSANYKLTFHDEKNNMGVYSFCMCPGGYILSSGTEADGLVCNGMSNFNRNSPHANAAIVVTIDHQKNFGEDVFGGINFRRNLESQAFQYVQKQGGTKELPGQKLVDFLKNKKSSSLLKTSIPSGAVACDFSELLPSFVSEKLKEGFEHFNDSMKNFINLEAQVFGVESRTSCPIRVTRDSDSLESLSHKGLYPTGEGAGYAGGITSAACDGIRVAEAIVKKMD